MLIHTLRFCNFIFTEAVHIANMLCQYGYFFPVNDSKTLTLKDDSSLYRFQVRQRLSDKYIYVNVLVGALIDNISNIILNYLRVESEIIVFDFRFHITGHVLKRILTTWNMRYTYQKDCCETNSDTPSKIMKR